MTQCLFSRVPLSIGPTDQKQFHGFSIAPLLSFSSCENLVEETFGANSIGIRNHIQKTRFSVWIWTRAIIRHRFSQISSYCNSITDLLGDCRQVPCPLWSLMSQLSHQWICILNPVHQQWHSRISSVSY